MKQRMTAILAVFGLGVLVWMVCFWQKPTAPAELEKDWQEQVYALDDDEVVRVVLPSYPSGRNLVSESRTRRFANTSRTNFDLATFRQWGLYVGYVNGLTRADLDWQGNLDAAKVAGDWIWRVDAPVERRM